MLCPNDTFPKVRQFWFVLLALLVPVFKDWVELDFTQFDVANVFPGRPRRIYIFFCEVPR